MKNLVLAIAILAHTTVLWADYPADPGSRGVDWEAVRRRVQEETWAREYVAGVEGQTRAVMRRYETPPLGETGWYHDYFCPEDAHKLQFDPDKPHEHVCPSCKKVYSGRPYNQCWNSNVHREIIQAMQDAGMLCRITGKQEYFDYVRRMLLWYAEHYDEFEIHGRHAGKGRIRSQSLDEATHLVAVATAYWDICPDLTPEERGTIIERYFLPDADLIHGQTSTIHNIHSWHNAGVGLVGFVSGRQDLVKKAIDGPYGLRRQIQKGVREDGFWYEGSVGYHFYTISSLEPLYIAAAAQGISMEGTEKFLRMYHAPMKFTFDNGEFPACNDGWPGATVRNLNPVYELAAGISGSPELAKFLAWLYDGRRRTGTDALLYGPDMLPAAETFSQGSTLLDDTGSAILRNDAVNVYLKFGPYGGGHDHQDRLNMIFFARGEVIMPDLGTSGYGIPLNRKWFRAPAAHNMLVVDGKYQKPCSGELVSFDQNHIAAGVKDAYEGVAIQRKIGLLGDGFIDEVAAVSSEPHTYDLFYHVRGMLADCDRPLSPVEAFAQGNGYDVLRDLKKADAMKEATLRFDLRDVPGELVLKIRSAEPFELITAHCPDNPANETMTAVLLRRTSANADWRCEVRVK